MSLWSSLLQTYDAVNSSAGITPLNEDVNKTLLPLYHTTSTPIMTRSSMNHISASLPVGKVIMRS